MSLDPYFDNADTSGGPSSCWPWKGTMRPDGYGADPLHRHWNAHRTAYEIVNGPVPDGLVLDHLCRNRACVNPAHLEPVTDRENLLRGEGICAKNARKTHCKRGHPFDEANTYFYNSPTWGTLRKCRACLPLDRKQYRASPEKRERDNARKREARRKAKAAREGV